MELNEIFEKIKTELDLASKQSKHPWHIMQLGTLNFSNNDENNLVPRVEIRSVVFKEINFSDWTIYFHSDSRSPKIKQVKNNNSACLHFYDSIEKTQLRMDGQLNILDRSHPTYLNHFKNLSPSGLRCYSGPYSPSSELNFFHSNIQEKWLNKSPTKDEMPNELEFFETLQFKIKSIDYLKLRAQGHVRCQFDFTQSSHPFSTWLAP